MHLQMSCMGYALVAVPLFRLCLGKANLRHLFWISPHRKISRLFSRQDMLRQEALGGWDTSRGKYNSGKDQSTSILACPAFAVFESWEPAQSTNPSRCIRRTQL